MKLAVECYLRAWFEGREKREFSSWNEYCSCRRNVLDLWGWMACRWPQSRNILLFITHWIARAFFAPVDATTFFYPSPPALGRTTASRCGLPVQAADGDFLPAEHTTGCDGPIILSHGHGFGAWFAPGISCVAWVRLLALTSQESIWQRGVRWACCFLEESLSILSVSLLF